MTSYRFFGGNTTVAGEGWSVGCNNVKSDQTQIYYPGFCSGLDTRFDDAAIQATWPFAQIFQAGHEYAIALYSVVLADLDNAALSNVPPSPMSCNSTAPDSQRLKPSP